MEIQWKQFLLGEVCRSVSSRGSLIKGKQIQKYSVGLYPAFSATGQDIWREEYEHEGEAIIVSAVGARCGKCFRTDGKWTAVANTHIIFPKENVDRNFLFYQVNNENFWEKGGVAQPFIKIKDSLRRKTVTFPVDKNGNPNLVEQKRIVTILEEAENLKNKRAEADQKMDVVILALFNKMFGNPEDSLIPAKKLIEIVDPQRPITYGILKPGPNKEDGVPYVRVVDIKQNHLHVDQLRRTTTEIANQYKRSKLEQGDILVTIRGTVGRTCMVPEALKGANITQDTARLSILPSIMAEYVVWFLNTAWAQSWMSRHMIGQAVQGINLGDLKELPILIPPMLQQRQFVDKAREIIIQKEKQKQSAENIDKIYQSLLSRYFTT